MSKRRNKKYVPKCIPGSLPIVFSVAADTKRQLHITPHMCVEAFRLGNGDRDKAFTLVNAIDLGAVLVQKYVEDEPKKVMQAGLSAVQSVINRGQGGKWGCTGDELTAITAAVALSDQLQQMSTRREVRDALMVVWKEAA